MSRRTRILVNVGVYLVLALVWLYGVVDHGDLRDRIGNGVVLGVTLPVYFVLASFLASWWALLLPVATIVLALPAGRNPSLESDLDFVFFDPLYALPTALLGTFLGTLAGRYWFGRRE